MRLSENSVKIRKLWFGVSSDVECLYDGNKMGLISLTSNLRIKKIKWDIPVEHSHK